MEEELQELGLSANEAKTYLAALEMGPISVQDLSTYTKIKRSTIYLALDSLMKAGLVSENYTGKKRKFQAEAPDKLEKLAKRMKRKAVEAERLLATLLPALKQIIKSDISDPKITYYQGLNGIKNVLLDVSASTVSWYVFGSSTKLLKNLPPSDLREILEEGEKLRQQSGRPKIYFVTDEGILALKEFKEIILQRREIKIISKEISFGSALILYGNKIAMISTGQKPFASVIESRELAEMVKFMYQFVWKNLG